MAVLWLYGSIDTHEQYYPLSILCSSIEIYALYSLSGTQHHLCIYISA